MPTYDYKCLECSFTFEEFQKMTDAPLEVCPSCNGKVKRLIGSGAAPIFKGSGFYQTDYKNAPKTTKTDKVDAKPETKKPATSNDIKKAD
jgi:putative FmdB family regulatory protein